MPAAGRIYSLCTIPRARSPGPRRTRRRCSSWSRRLLRRSPQLRDTRRNSTSWYRSADRSWRPCSRRRSSTRHRRRHPGTASQHSLVQLCRPRYIARSPRSRQFASRCLRGHIPRAAHPQPRGWSRRRTRGNDRRPRDPQRSPRRSRMALPTPSRPQLGAVPVQAWNRKGSSAFAGTLRSWRGCGQSPGEVRWNGSMGSAALLSRLRGRRGCRGRRGACRAGRWGGSRCRRRGRGCRGGGRWSSSGRRCRRGGRAWGRRG